MHVQHTYSHVYMKSAISKQTHIETQIKAYTGDKHIYLKNHTIEKCAQIHKITHSRKNHAHTYMHLYTRDIHAYINAHITYSHTHVLKAHIIHRLTHA